MQQVRRSLANAWQTLRSNWIVVWFPALVGIGFSMLAIMLTGLIVKLGFDWVGTGQLGGSLAITLLFVPLVLIVAVAVAAGQAEMFRGAAADEVVKLSYFTIGMRRFFWRFLGAFLIMGLISVIIVVIFMGSALAQMSYFGTQLITGYNNSLIQLLYQINQFAPSATFGTLLLIIINFLLGAWVMYVVVDDEDIIPAYVNSFRLITGNMGPFFLLALLNVFVQLFLQEINRGDIILLSLITSIIWSSYFQLARFSLFYQLRRLPTPPPVERAARRQEPPELLV